MKVCHQNPSFEQLAIKPPVKPFNRFWQPALAASLGVLLLSSLFGSAAAQTVQSVPNPRQADSWISDTEDLISPQSEAALDQQLSALEAQTGIEMAVVTVSDTSGSTSPKAFATELFNLWGVGKADQDNGVLFLVSVGDRRAEVEVGYGLETILTKDEVERLLEKDAVPNFKQGDFDRGIVLATQSMAAQLREQAKLEGTDSLASDAFSAVNALTAQPLAIKILVIGSGAIAFVFVRFGTSWLAAPVALTPGTQSRRGLVDFEAISQTVSHMTIGFTSCFGLGAIAFLLTGVGFPLVGGAISGVLGAIGLSVKKSSEKVGPFECKDCGVSLNRVDSTELNSHLSKPQRVAASQLGSAVYKGWECPDCSGFSLRCVYPWSRYKQCPRCQEPTVVESSSVITRSTYHHSGQKQISRTCRCCDYSSSRFVTLPRLEEQSSHASSSGSSYSGSSGGGSSGGSFGGGSSGGGGGGADW